MKYGYHRTKIKKGKYGKLSKIREEYQELKDAVKQKNKLLILCECSDLVGAIEKFIQTRFRNLITIQDLLKMAHATKRAFAVGERGDCGDCGDCGENKC